MSRTRWQFVDATPDERVRFPTATAALAAAGELAAPRNRLREVRRIVDGDRTWYLKHFERTQWKNQLRHRLTAPRCARDGVREALVAAALREAGVTTARVVAFGVDGAASYFLCAALDGRSLAELRAAGALTRELLFAAARFAGDIARRGIVLPDLSLDHVYVLRGVAPRFAVLDLHNGRTGAANAADARRWLRRLARTLRDDPLPRPLALGAALRFLDAAGLRRHARAAVRAAPPIETHGRYDVPGRSAGYATRNPTRHRAELALLARVWPAAVENAGPAPTVLDVPCGAGRLSTFVGGRGGRWIGADRAAAMLTQARAAGAGPLVHADARAMPFRNAAVDGVVVFRFLHHLEREAAHAVVAEAARVARTFVVVSFFHPVSAHGVVRTIRTWLSGRSRTRHALTCGRLDGWLAVHGFERCAAAAQSPFLRDLWIVAYRRR